MSPYSMRQGRSGFSLTELIAALAIFSMGIMACVELYTASLRSTSNSLDYSQAVLLAQGLMEETLADTPLVAKTDSGDFGDSFPHHTWETEIEDTEKQGVLKVHVVVKWKAVGVEKEYELTTLSADRDVAVSLS